MIAYTTLNKLFAVFFIYCCVYIIDRLSEVTSKNAESAGRYSAALLQIGRPSNDLTNNGLSEDDWLLTLRRHIELLLEKYAVERVVVMEILYRKAPLRHRMQMTVVQFNRKVQGANEAIERMCTTSEKIV